ncbi:MAG: hypothetical protein WAK93_07290 [Solirubrobacteraceae bacterium]
MSSDSESSGESGGDEPLVTPLEESGGGDSPAPSAPASGGESAVSSSAPAAGRPEPSGRPQSSNMLPRDHRRSMPERLLVRLIATCGIVAIGVAIAAIMVSSNSQGWIVGLVVSIVSVVLAAILWSSRIL